MSVDFSYYRSLTETVFRDRKWIVAMDVLVPAAAMAQTLLDHGAAGVLAVGGSRGSGDLPDPALIPQFELGVVAEDMMSGIRRAQDALARVPPQVQAAIDAFDPERGARAVVAHFSDGRPVGGRPVYASRPATWQAPEDKTTIDGLWPRADVEHERVLIAAANLESLRRAREQLAAAGDVVLSGDNREGFNGGAQYVRWVRTQAHLEQAAEFFAALRPCEMLVMRDSVAGRFVYASVATFWEPDARTTEEMRGVARRVGRLLREDYGYRGTFTVDGVYTTRGFRPTELNPRFGAGMMVLGRGLQACSLYLLNLAVMAGEDLDFRPRDLEALILEHAAAHPCGGGAQSTRVRIEEMTEGGLLLEPDGVRLVARGVPADASFSLGPAPTGGRCRVDLDPSRTPRGASAAPRVAQALRFLGEHFDLGFPPMEIGDPGGWASPARDSCETRSTERTASSAPPTDTA